MKLRPVVLMIAILFATVANAATITFDDLYSIPRATDPRLSPNGGRVVFVLNTSDPVANERASHLWLMNADGTDQRQLTHGPTSESHPRWSADGGSILFLANRDGATQIWRLPLDGGEAQAVTSIATGVSGFVVSPRGNDVVFVSRVFPDCHDDSCSRARQHAIDNRAGSGRLYDRLLYRHYNRWDDGKVNRLFVHDSETGATRELFANAHDAPTALLGGYGDYDVAPDGGEVCFVMSVDSIPAVAVNNDLYVIPIGGGTPERITENRGLDTSPSYSPNGRFIGYHRMARYGYESDQRDLVIYDRREKTHRNLTEGFDRSVGGFVWGPDTRFVYFTAIDHGFNMVWRVEVGRGNVERLLDDAVHAELRVAPGGQTLMFRRSTADAPYELYAYDVRTTALSRLTHFTEPIVADLELKHPHEFWFAGALGDSVHGFLTLPPGWDRAEKYPLVLLIHGGPQWCWLGDFNYYGWNTQLMAAQGYVVAQIDPHGSIGYGLTFKEYVSGHWGVGDYEDLMLGVDHMIATFPFIDTTRMAALGRSYGGFMANWICGHTDRFRCLVSVSGTSNHIGKYGSTEELWFPEWDFGGTLWENWAEYERSSPIRYAQNFKTPTMVIHGQLDYRVDLSQGLQMFTALQRQGVPSRLLYFPDEGHSVRKLENLRMVYDEQLKWLARWLR